MKILLVGASSSIAQEYYNLYSSSAEIYRTSSMNSDLLIHLDAEDETTYTNLSIDYDRIICFIGYTPDVKDNYSFEELKKIVNINFIFPLNLIKYILYSNQNQNLFLQVVTSVASIRGRKLNFEYGAAKSALGIALSGLSQKYPEISIQEIVLGPVRTKKVPIHQTPDFLVSRPVMVAKMINKSYSYKSKIYIPFYWRYIALILKNIPIQIYRKLNF
jgi:hypothetical protein